MLIGFKLLVPSEKRNGPTHGMPRDSGHEFTSVSPFCRRETPACLWASQCNARHLYLVIYLLGLGLLWASGLVAGDKKLMLDVHV